MIIEMKWQGREEIAAFCIGGCDGWAEGVESDGSRRSTEIMGIRSGV
jgi:hypothetical protein